MPQQLSGYVAEEAWKKIKEFNAAHSRTPTVAELTELMSFASRNSTYRILHILSRAGYIVFQRNKPRPITIKESLLPIFYVDIKAGQITYGSEWNRYPVDLPQLLQIQADLEAGIKRAKRIANHGV